MTEVTRLDREGRIVELAQMLGGIDSSRDADQPAAGAKELAAPAGTAAFASARELLDRAEAWRARVAASV